jgi:hypothetical protein
MPQSKLEQLANLPEYKAILNRLERWLGTQHHLTIDPRTLAREWPDVRTEQLAVALQLLVQSGVLRQVFKVLTPNGVLVDAEFDDPRAIPDRVSDRFNHYFDTAEADIVPVFKQR